MEFEKCHWSKNDFENLREYEKTIKGSEHDCSWEQKIVNTKLECFARTSSKAKETAKQIKKGNYLEFLENIEIQNHFESLVVVNLINTIKDFKTYEECLDRFVLTIDNWSSVDTLKFDKIDNENLVYLSEKYLNSDKPFVRRLGVNFWFELIKDENYFSKAFEVLDKLADEQEYYVNMSGAWLLAECMAKNREKTIEYFENHKTNAFVINKGISKCRDSFRVSQEDKDFLLKFKIKPQKNQTKNAKINK